LPASLAAIVPVFIGAVAAHGDKLALRLLVANEFKLRLRRRLSEKIVDPRLGRDRCRRQRIVAGDHHRPYAHLAQFAEPLPDATLDDVLQIDDPKQLPIFRDGERCSP
jgi:hypothetical protein